MSEFYGILTGALFAFQSVLLSVFCSLISIYARYKTTKGCENLRIVATIKKICLLIYVVMAVIMAFVSAALYLIGDLQDCFERKIILWFLIAINIAAFSPIPMLYHSLSPVKDDKDSDLQKPSVEVKND